MSTGRFDSAGHREPQVPRPILKVHDHVYVQGGGDRTYLVRAVGDAGRDVYVVGNPDSNLGTWVSIEQVTLAEFGRAES